MNAGATIIEQLGGNKFFAMTGCKAAIDGTSAFFTIPRNASKANRFEVEYDEATDTYTMRFFRFTNGRFNKKTYEYIEPKERTIAEFDGVHWYMLAELFTQVTGMHTRLV